MKVNAPRQAQTVPLADNLCNDQVNQHLLIAC